MLFKRNQSFVKTVCRIVNAAYWVSTCDDSIAGIPLEKKEVGPVNYPTIAYGVIIF